MATTISQGTRTGVTAGGNPHLKRCAEGPVHILGWLEPWRETSGEGFLTG